MTHGGLKKGGCRGASQVQGVTACPERPGVGGSPRAQRGRAWGSHRVPREPEGH